MYDADFSELATVDTANGLDGLSDCPLDGTKEALVELGTNSELLVSVCWVGVKVLAQELGAWLFLLGSNGLIFYSNYIVLSAN